MFGDMKKNVVRDVIRAERIRTCLYMSHYRRVNIWLSTFNSGEVLSDSGIVSGIVSKIYDVIPGKDYHKSYSEGKFTLEDNSSGDDSSVYEISRVYALSFAPINSISEDSCDHVMNSTQHLRPFTGIRSIFSSEAHYYNLLSKFDYYKEEGERPWEFADS
ncbi:hypothetical protein [Desulfogranum marinum]|uniref:hypothetical protein n=1 Tax=Desulfogranum marinum TaxID=453220 RepID=UPI001964A2DE|nr:hypothetical protein [Desulfogranum marinum]MBM9515210.1 hypothetical protein [Desulfogranum marinum]